MEEALSRTGYVRNTHKVLVVKLEEVDHLGNLLI